MSRWMRECQTAHPQCAIPHSTILPSRLLEVDWLVDGEPRIFLREIVRADMQYIALSYCWGSGARLPPKCLVETHQHYLDGVPLSSLPNTFQDGFQCAKKLNCKYLWIDALCIIQDSRDDVFRELGKMGDIYTNSLLTLAAAGGEDSHAGLFLPRKQSAVPDARVPWDNDIDSSYSLHVRVNTLPFNKLGYGSQLKFCTEYLDGPLCQRAWTYQERLLPTRILHFGKYQLVWECYTKTCFEGRNLEEDFQGDGELVTYKSRQKHAICTDNHQLKAILYAIRTFKLAPAAIYERWYLLLHQYSSRLISFDGDKLRAVDGLQSVMAAKLGDALVYGIWKRDIAIGLLWRMEDGTNVAVKRTTLSLPSWSWARYHGVVQHGWFTLIEGQFEAPGSKGDALIDAKEMEAGRIFIFGLVREIDPAQLQAWSDEFMIFLDETFDEGPPSDTRPVWQLQIATFLPPIAMRDRLSHGEDYTLGLCIRETKEQGIFERIGVFSIEAAASKEGWAWQNITLI